MCLLVIFFYYKAASHFKLIVRDIKSNLIGNCTNYKFPASFAT